MAENKTQPTNMPVDEFLSTVDGKRRKEAATLVDIMKRISGAEPIMWGSSIIGFGSKHYSYDTGRQGDMPVLSFSPRKSAITIYVAEGFDRYGALLDKLGKFKASVSCLYVSKLEDIDLEVLRQMLDESHKLSAEPLAKPETVEEYISRIPTAAGAQFEALRSVIKGTLPDAEEVLSYGIVGYKVDAKRPRVFISGWKDHVAMYPIPKNEALQAELTPYTRGKGTLWFSLGEPLPSQLIEKTVIALAKD